MDPSLAEVFVTVFLSKNPCGYTFYRCPFCCFWVGSSYGPDLERHIKVDHVQGWRGVKSTVVARIGSSGKHVIFPEFEGTNVDDEAIQKLIHISLFYLKRDQFVTMPYIKVIRFRPYGNHFICPFCRFIAPVEETIKAHLPSHLRISFRLVRTVRSKKGRATSYCTLQIRPDAASPAAA
jgi:hypothetical protein